MINLDDTTALNRIADALERIAGLLDQIDSQTIRLVVNLPFKLKFAEPGHREQSSEKGNSNDNTETAEEV